jgi:1,4-alpha-glucan branching enzyme
LAVNIAIEMAVDQIQSYDSKLHEHSGDRLLPGRTVKPVNFYCVASKAHSVYLAGDFNDWNPTSHPMRRQVDGCWTLQLRLSHGHQRYHSVVDGNAMLDSRAVGVVRNDRGEQVSLIAVS